MINQSQANLNWNGYIHLIWYENVLKILLTNVLTYGHNRPSCLSKTAPGMHEDHFHIGGNLQKEFVIIQKCLDLQ